MPRTRPQLLSNFLISGMLTLRKVLRAPNLSPLKFICVFINETTPVISALGNQTQAGKEFEASLGYNANKIKSRTPTILKSIYHLGYHYCAEGHTCHGECVTSEHN